MEVAEQFFTQTSNTTRWCPSVLLKNIAHYHPKTDSLVKYLIDRQGSLLSWTYLKIELHTTKTSTPPYKKKKFSPTLFTYLWFWAIIVSVCNCDNYYFNIHKRKKIKIFYLNSYTYRTVVVGGIPEGTRSNCRYMHRTVDPRIHTHFSGQFSWESTFVAQNKITMHKCLIHSMMSSEFQ